MANKKPIVIYNGIYSQLKEEDNILDTHSNSIAVRAESIAKKSESMAKRNESYSREISYAIL